MINTRAQVQTKRTPKSSFIPGGRNLLRDRSTEQAEPPLVPPILHDILPIFKAKLTIGQPNDQYEQEADRVADRVMRMPEPKIQRVCPECEDELQRQPMEEEEEETLQSKPLADQITPLVQRQAEPMEEEEETLQSKTTSGQPPTVSARLQNRITTLRRGGQPLPQSERAFFEPRFGADFSQVRIHADNQAAETASAVNARAFTLGRDIVFGAGQYRPSASEGRQLLAHELTHVVQQKKKQIREERISRWSAKDHGKITKEIIESDFSKDFSTSSKEMAAYYSGEMDLRGCNYLWYAPPKIPIIGLPWKKSKPYYKLSEYEAPNHGEANLYKYTDKTSLNDQRMQEYAQKAIKKGNNEGINDHSIFELGMALHVGQDRGAHEEGLPGKGHARKHDETGKKWNPDNLTQNNKGKDVAKDHSRNVIKTFISGLNEKRKSQLKYSKLSTKSIGKGTELSLARSLSEEKPIFYAGLMKYKLLPEHRLFGVFSPIFKSGFLLSGGEKGFGTTLKVKTGLRLLRVPPRIYVDVLTGGYAGVNFSDKQFMAGLSATVQAHYTGQEADFGLMLSNMYDFVGGKNVLIIGVSGRY